MPIRTSRWSLTGRRAGRRPVGRCLSFEGLVRGRFRSYELFLHRRLDALLLYLSRRGLLELEFFSLIGLLRRCYVFFLRRRLVDGFRLLDGNDWFRSTRRLGLGARRRRHGDGLALGILPIERRRPGGLRQPFRRRPPFVLLLAAEPGPPAALRLGGVLGTPFRLGLGLFCRRVDVEMASSVNRWLRVLLARFYRIWWRRAGRRRALLRFLGPQVGRYTP